MRVVACVAVLIAFAFACQASPPKKPGLMLGGQKPVSIDSDVTSVGEWAVTELNSKQNVAGKPLSFLQVVSAKKQVVAGTNYFLELEAKDASGTTQSYHVTVFKGLPTATNEQQLQLSKYEHAKEGMMASGACGGHQEWEAAAQQLVSQINARSNSMFPYVLSSVAGAVPANDHSSVELTLVLVRSGKQETMRVKGERRADNHYRLLEAAPAAPPHT